VLSITMSIEPDAEVRFVAGTEKGFFWSNDAAEWTQAEPSGFPIRVNRIIRFNRTRSFAATAEGVFTTRDGGKNWYRLAGADASTVDIALGMIGERRSLFALAANGLTAFDGEKWLALADAPSTGRTLAVRIVDGLEHVLVAGAQGVKAGRIDAEGRWLPADAPDAQYAAVYGSSDHHLFLTSRKQREILVGTAGAAEWLHLVLPSQHTEVTSVAADPFSDRFYVGTVGEGVFVYDGRTRRVEETGTFAGGSGWR
jgi:photosystem II stability/assembly factor-like uncharacterized protein